MFKNNEYHLEKSVHKHKGFDQLLGGSLGRPVIPIRTNTSAVVAMPPGDGSRKTEKTAQGRFFAFINQLLMTMLTEITSQ